MYAFFVVFCTQTITKGKRDLFMRQFRLTVPLLLEKKRGQTHEKYQRKEEREK
jgi:hypothetical protein